MRLSLKRIAYYKEVYYNKEYEHMKRYKIINDLHYIGIDIKEGADVDYETVKSIYINVLGYLKKRYNF